MIIAINYANKKYRRAQKLNTKCAHKHGVDKVIEYYPENIPKSFINDNISIWSQVRGNGYWIWKPYIIIDALKNAEYGDYIIYTDAGSAFVNDVNYLIADMDAENVDVMAFAIDEIEKKWTKRDAFIITGTDEETYFNTAQICATFIIVKKTDYTLKLINNFLEYATNDYINTDRENRLGYDNYEGFIENRHDQTAWSLLCKKEKIRPFRDPSQWGNDTKKYEEEVNARSHYGQIFESHRKGWISFEFQMNYNVKWWYYPLRKAIKGFYKILRILGYEYGCID